MYYVVEIPLSRGDKGVCDDEKRGRGKAIAGGCLMRCLVLRGSICQTSVTIFVLGDCAQAQPTPDPSPEGRLEILFSI